MNYLSFLLLGSLLIVTACSQHARMMHLGVTNDNKAYSRTPDNWVIKGKLGVRTAAESGSVTINWLQQKDRYTIHVNGPLGQGAARIETRGQRTPQPRPHHGGFADLLLDGRPAQKVQVCERDHC